MTPSQMEFLGGLPTSIVDALNNLELMRKTRDSLSDSNAEDIRFKTRVREMIADLISNIPNLSERELSRRRFWEVLEHNGFFNFTQKDKIRFDLGEDDPRAWNAKRRNHAKRLAKRAAKAASSAE